MSFAASQLELLNTTTLPDWSTAAQLMPLEHEMASRTFEPSTSVGAAQVAPL